MNTQTQSIRPSTPGFLDEGGETGALIRARDWSAHPLGQPDSWPQPLKTAVGLMLSTGHPMCLTWGVDLSFFYNDAYARILTTRHPQAMGRPIAEVWADIWPDIAPLVAQALAGQAIWQEDMHLRMSRDGRAEDTWWTFSYSPLRDEGGAVRGFINLCNDVTGKVLVERRLTAEREALRDSEARYRTLFSSIDEGFCVIEFIDGPHGSLSDYVHVEANPAYLANVGIPDIVGKRLREIVGDEADAWAETYRHVLVTGEPVRFERELMATCRHLELAAFRIEPPERRQVAVLFRDVTDRKRIEAALAASRVTLQAEVAARTAELRQFRDIVEATASPICAFDTQFRLIAFNRAHNEEFRRVNGFDTKLGDVFPDLFIAEQQPVMRALMSRALSGEPFTVTQQLGRPELGQPTWEISYTPLRNESGSIIGAFHLANDISDRLRAEADLMAAQDSLRQSQKMEAMGSLTGGVAHDFNNLLTPIVGALDILGRKGLGGEREQRLIAGAAQAAERAKVLVQRLLAFARRQPLQPVAVDVARLVESMADLVASTTGPQIRVVVDVAENLPSARTDPNQLEMALLNLAVNARDAMPDGGTLRISATADSIPAGARGELLPGRYVRLSVADTGSGMNEATQARAIEPFFSTKGIGKGTGLGLSMVHGFASQLGGGLTIWSKLGVGTNIELWLPQTESEPELPGSVQEAGHSRGRGVALLVDDEEIVRLSTADMLGELGYQVIEAATAEQALQKLDGGTGIDLLVTDHLMPGMTGTDLARAVALRHPELPVLLVSGYSEVEGVAPDLPRLTKPFRKDELAASLANLRPSATA